MPAHVSRRCKRGPLRRRSNRQIPDVDDTYGPPTGAGLFLRATAEQLDLDAVCCDDTSRAAKENQRKVGGTDGGAGRKGSGRSRLLSSFRSSCPLSQYANEHAGSIVSENTEIVELSRRFCDN